MKDTRMAQAETSTQVATEPTAVAAPQSIADVADSLNMTFLGIWDGFIKHTPYLIAGLMVLLLTWIAVAIFRRVAGRALSRSGLRSSLRELLLRLVAIAIWFAGLLLAAMFWFPGLTPTTALGGLGLLSVAVGFAFQDIFENFFAGILLLWRFPFENGDYIECEGIMGEVEDVTVRMTKIRQTTGELVLVPNSVLFKNPVNVMTNRGARRVDIVAGVSYDSDVEQATEIIEKAVKACNSVLGDRPIQVFPQAFGASSIDIEVAWWTEAKPVDIRASRAEVVCAVKRALDEAGIEIPFPYRTLTLKEPLPTKRVDNNEAA
ncbi:MAG: mechanosensitive ion channel family protein [Gammaproteobacteria bacterium]|nr:mechanosensitive ion channel family protein [Gammaproteobacteria bacterium]